jgi:uncharacterized protein YjbI with pentapeptide repeats
MERDVTESEFIEMLQNGQRHFHKICVEAGIYHRFDFSGMTFDECLFSVDFAGSNFENAKILNSNLKSCDFSNCIFKEAVLVSNSLDGAEFKEAFIEGIAFSENTFHSFTLTERHLADMIK